MRTLLCRFHSNITFRPTYLFGCLEWAAVCRSSTCHIGAVRSVLNENGLVIFSSLSPVPHHWELLPWVNSTCCNNIDFIDFLKKSIKSLTSLFPYSLGSFICCGFAHKLTIDIKDPVSVWIVSSIVIVSEGNASRQGMLGNTKQYGTDFSLNLQGHHPGEWTSGILASLVYTQTNTHKEMVSGHKTNEWLYVCCCAFVCVSVCCTEAKLCAGLVGPLSLYSPAWMEGRIHQILHCFLMGDVKTWFLTGGMVDLQSAQTFTHRKHLPFGSFTA